MPSELDRPEPALARANPPSVGTVRPDAAHPRRLLLRVLQTLGSVVVLVVLGRHVWKLSREWSDPTTGIQGVTIHAAWVVAAGVLYLVGQVCFSGFWFRALERCDVSAAWVESLRAYSVGTLGKYIPGKAWVVVLRTMLVPDGKVSRVSIGLTVLYETLATMAVGGMLAFVCLLLIEPGKYLYWAGGGGVAAGFLIALHPAVFERVVKLASLPFKRTATDPIALGGSGLLMRYGVLEVAGWLLSGASFAAVILAMDGGAVSLSDGVLLTGVVCLATTVGFVVVFMPAGIGVRELVIIQLLTPRYGPSQAVVASLLLRTVWTVAELLLAGLLYGGAPVLRKLAARGDLPAARD